MPIDVSDLIGILKEYFAAERPDLAAVYLFGSVARGRDRPSSDVDLGLLFGQAPEPGISGPAARIEDELEHRLRRPVHAVVLDTAPPDLVHRVFRDGRLVHEGDRRTRVRFEVARRREYFDLLPVLRRYRRADVAVS